jgi:hypothetical protein
MNDYNYNSIGLRSCCLKRETAFWFFMRRRWSIKGRHMTKIDQVVEMARYQYVITFQEAAIIQTAVGYLQHEIRKTGPGKLTSMKKILASLMKETEQTTTA